MFIQSKLASAAAAAAMLLAACGGSEEATNPAPATPAVEAATERVEAAASAAETDDAAASTSTRVAFGRFEGRSDHVTTGGVSIVRQGDRYALILAGNFSLDGAPDPVVGFGKGGEYDAASQVAALESNTGRQRYLLPEDFDPTEYDEAYIWCEQFSVPLGVASLIVPETVKTGAFEGRSDHVTTGGVSVVKEGGRHVLVFADDFSLDGAPDPVVGFGNGGEYDAASQLGALENLTGGQRYALPASFDPAAYGEAYVWCEQFSVPLGVASLN